MQSFHEEELNRMKNILIVGGGFAGVMASVNAADQIDQHGGDLVVWLLWGHLSEQLTG